MPFPTVRYMYHVQILRAVFLVCFFSHEQGGDHSRLILLAHGEVPHQLARAERLCDVFARLHSWSRRLKGAWGIVSYAGVV